MPEMKKANICNTFCDVTTLSDYAENKDAYISSHTAIQEGDYVLPIRTQTSSMGKEVGVYVGSALAKFIMPETEEDKKSFSSDNMIDFTETKTIGEVIAKQESVRKLEREVLTSPDNIFTPVIEPDDSNEMKGMKEAVIAKNIDLDKYEHRFGSNYNNDKRLFNKNNISLPMIKRLSKALDMKATLILEDASPDVPNPIGKKIIIDVIGNDEDGE